MKHEDITGKIIGCAMEVHNRLGSGFQEFVYQKALAIEMKLQGLTYVEEQEMIIFYRETDIAKRRVDFWVENKVSVEIKARTELTDEHFAQAMNYLEVLKIEIGLLLNIGAKRLEFKRLHNNKLL